MLALWEKTCQAEGNSKYRGPAGNMSGMLDKHLGTSVSGTECKEIKSERKQEATLCNPVFSTEAVGLFGSFVQIEKRCFLWAHAAAQVLDLATQVWPGIQSLLEAFGTAQRWHSPTWWAWACHLQCSYARVEPFFKHWDNTCVFRGGLKSSCLLTPPPAAPACGSAALRQPDRTVWKPFCRRRGDGGYRRHKSAWV